MNTEMTAEMTDLLENIRSDYSFKERTDDIAVSMTKEFNDNLSYTVGSKYIKVMTKSSVWGFVVNTDNDKKFKKGDILKPAGYNAPARNKPRGNIVDGGYTVRWTGPLYL